MRASLLAFFLAASALSVAPRLQGAAAPDLAERIARCALEKHDARRLACYDAQAAQLPEVVQAAGAGGPAPAAPKDEFGVKGSELAREQSKPQATAAAAKPAAAAAASPNGATDAAVAGEFGVQGSELARQRKRDTARVETKVERLTAKVAELKLRPRGELVVTLDNGQVWAQKKAASYFPLKVGDSVTILAGALGSFHLIVAERSTAVTRIQ